MNTHNVTTITELVELYNGGEDFYVNGVYTPTKVLGIAYSLVFLKEMISGGKIKVVKEHNK